jgi:hypothetical protein
MLQQNANGLHKVNQRATKLSMSLINIVKLLKY